MEKSSRKINNIVKGFLFLGSCVGASAFVRANPMGECTEEKYSSSVNLEKGAVQRAQKIVNLALFDAIDQGSLKGITFLLEGGADPTAENRWGRTPLEFAESLANKNPEELERQVVVDSLRDWDSEHREVDDATAIATAREIWGLRGGEKIKKGGTSDKGKNSVVSRRPFCVSGRAIPGVEIVKTCKNSIPDKSSSNKSSSSQSSRDYGTQVTQSLLAGGCSVHAAAVAGSLASSGCSPDTISAIIGALDDSYSEED